MTVMASRIREAAGDILPAVLVHAAFAAAIVAVVRVGGSIWAAGLLVLP